MSTKKISATNCPSCGLTWNHHTGIIAMCEENATLKSEVRELRTLLGRARKVVSDIESGGVDRMLLLVKIEKALK